MYASRPAGPGTHALRQGRVSNEGQVYLVTTVVEDRSPVFAQWPAATAASRIASAGMGDAHFVAWVVMPDHFHGLLLTGKRLSLSAAMRLFKGRVAREVNLGLGRAGKLWQAGFHDHAMRRDEDLERMARYIVANPVRAGLVAKVGDYPYWNADWI